MGNKDRSILVVGAFVSLFGVMVSLMYFNDKPNVVITTNICKEDSLQNVINELQMELKIQSDGFDSKERRYEDVLFEYEFGIDRIRETHPSAYKEFHRIISHKESYSHEDERENKKRLNIKDEYNR
jgi:hypothetical protein